MNQYHDQTYLLNSQYKDTKNFDARVRLHRRFSVNKYGWHHWVFDQFKLDEGSKLLELGCGPGLLWLSNRHRIPASWQITLENGQEVLAPFFAQVTKHTYEDALEVTEAEPLTEYAFSGRIGSLLSSEEREKFTGMIRQELVGRGTIHITNAAGIFEARKV